MGQRRGEKMCDGREYDLKDFDFNDYDLVDEDCYDDYTIIFWKGEGKPQIPKGDNLKDYIIMGIGKRKRNSNPPAAGNSSSSAPPPPATDSSSSSAPPPPWIELPRDVTANILHRLSPAEILRSAQSVCSTWRSVCADPSFWRVFDMKYSDPRIRTLHAGRVCRLSVDRSQGEMIDITIRHFGSNGLLNYISKRLTNLKKLTLESCHAITPRSMREAIKNLTRLEELHLFYVRLPLVAIETIGASCPMLNSFTSNIHVFEKNMICDNSIALSIAKNLPNLRQLRLVGNWLDNEGLLAILDGCPNLELLDLLQCFNVDLECELGRRCSEHVKMLRRPLDSSADCMWDARDYDFKDYDPVVDEEDSCDDYSDTYSRGCPSCFEENYFYNPYYDYSDFVWDGRRSENISDVKNDARDYDLKDYDDVVDEDSYDDYTIIFWRGEGKPRIPKGDNIKDYVIMGIGKGKRNNKSRAAGSSSSSAPLLPWIRGS